MVRERVERDRERGQKRGENYLKKSPKDRGNRSKKIFITRETKK